MKKKGFTLIELLAVIIILAIVALVATPIILNVVNDARRSAGLSEARLIYGRINSYCEEAKLKEQLNGTESICKDGVTIEEVNQMVNLGNAKVTKLTYTSKVVELTVESNNHTYEFKEDGSLTIDGETSGKEPVVPPVEDNDYVDASGANKPDLLEKMTPIKYNGTNWVYADKTEEWYDYDKKEWANAVVLNDGITKNVGDTISDDEVALWYVWIPRYKYKLFNTGTTKIDAQLIDVEFENGTESSGTVSCTDVDFKTNTSSTVSEVCTNAEVGNWYTHPAFTFGNQELTGFWIGKFEISTTDETCSTSVTSNNCDKELKVTIAPNKNTWRYATIGTFYKSLANVSTAYNITSADSHMINNMEWGATAYLKQSAYGLGTTDIYINNVRKDTTTYDTETGCVSSGGSSQSTTCEYRYNTVAGVRGSTSGTVYGVYDMAGGAYEYVMGNMVTTTGNFNPRADYTGVNFVPDSKYYTTYAYGASYGNTSSKKYGDATLETSGWYNDSMSLPYGSSPWITRGGDVDNGMYAGVFNTAATYNGSNKNRGTSRSVLVHK